MTEKRFLKNLLGTNVQVLFSHFLPPPFSPVNSFHDLTYVEVNDNGRNFCLSVTFLIEQMID